MLMCRMEIYCKKVESLEMEKSRLQDLLSRNEKVKVSFLLLFLFLFIF